MLNFAGRIRDLIYFSVLIEKSAAILKGFVNPAQKNWKKKLQFICSFSIVRFNIEYNKVFLGISTRSKIQTVEFTIYSIHFIRSMLIEFTTL